MDKLDEPSNIIGDFEAQLRYVQVDFGVGEDSVVGHDGRDEY